MGYLQGGGNVSARRAAGLATLFAIGILVSIALIGAATAAAGRMLGDLGQWGNYAVAAVFFIFGLHLLGLISLPDSWQPQPNQPRRGPLGAFVFGLIFGIALGPCTFSFMAPVLGVTFSLASSSPAYALGILSCFALGHCVVIGFAGVSSAWIQRWVTMQDQTHAAQWMRRVCGVLVIAGGCYMIYTAHG
jgi:cytochrome c-type biogenesis protein